MAAIASIAHIAGCGIVPARSGARPRAFLAGEVRLTLQSLLGTDGGGLVTGCRLFATTVGVS